ncbi:MAG: hypothetical protein ACD_5C00206G0005 [uncultured bacterium]|nr:MAG: hypothetical protein ACD_5C00206G0005 [uncultured bacterium]
MLDIYQHLPQIISPIAFSIGSFNVRWYSISYLVGFLVTYLFLVRNLKNNNLKKDAQIFNDQFPISNKNQKIQNTILDFLLVNFFASFIGGRIGYVLLYDFSYFISHPLSIISPFASGKLTGFYGMSYHGALLAVILASFIFFRIKKINFWVWADLVTPAAALGYFFGRLGNFLNGELYGRATNSKLGMYFLSDPKVLRHPSQVYEAIGEGLILFFLIFKIRKIKLPTGSLFASYLIGYSIIRFMLEFFRQPDKQMGFYFDIFTFGQMLSFLMFGVGIILLVSLNKEFIKSE